MAAHVKNLKFQKEFSHNIRLAIIYKVGEKDKLNGERKVKKSKTIG